jgi:DnaA family protein
MGHPARDCLNEHQMAQLALALPRSPHARLDTFVAGRNVVAFKHVTALAEGARETLWLWGAPGCGKTHLLQAAARAADSDGKRAMYVGLDPAAALQPEVLRGLDALDFLAVDQVERVAGDLQWEKELFVLLNAFLARRGGLLLAGRLPPATAGWALPDLASRAAGAVVYRLEALDDEDQIAALIGHARARGLDLDRAAAEYLQHRVTRDMRGLTAWLERLDSASLAAQRRLTIPFIRELLADESRAYRDQR